MANTISNLLVGIGFDLDNKSADGVSSGIDSVKSKALKLGAVVAGAFGIKALTSDFSNAKDDLGKFSEVMGVSANNVHAFGAALRLEGGTLGGFMAQLEGIEKFRAGFKVGDIGFLPAAEKAGISTKTILEAKNAAEAYLSLADQFQKLSKQQRINAAQAMGLDAASIRLLSRGRKAVEQVIEQEKKRRSITIDMLKISAEYNDETQRLGDSIGSIGDQISKNVLPHINDVLKGMNSWIAANRTLIGSGIDTFFEGISDSVGLIAASLGLVTAGITATAGGAAVAKAGGALGLGKVATTGKVAGKVGGVASRLGAVGLAGAAGYVVGNITYDKLIAGTDFGDALGNAVAHSLAALDVGEARESIRRAESNAAISKNIQKPIIIHNTVEVDGQIVDKKVHKVIGEMADQAVQDLSSTEGG